MQPKDNTQENTQENATENIPENAKKTSGAESNSNPQKPEKTKNTRSTEALIDAYPELKQVWSTETAMEKKIAAALDGMQSALSNPDQPSFKKFWDIRKLTFPLFKEELDPEIRGSLWQKFTELSEEARNLKVLFEEQSSFAVEQIGLAIDSVEREVGEYEKHLQDADPVEIPTLFLFKNHEKIYCQTQKELSLLNALSLRISSLRKELISSAMRMKEKNAFFKRLSRLSDQVFPQRKEKIEQISSLFAEDVERFIQEEFQPKKKPLYELKQSIKILQSTAKLFSLNAKTFSSTRKKLSACWDEIKQKEKARKEEIQVKKERSKEEKAQIAAKIEEMLAGKKDLSSKAFAEKLSQIEKDVKSASVTREDKEELFERLSALKKPSQKVPDAYEETRSIDNRIAHLIENKVSMDLEDLYDYVDQLDRQIDKTPNSYAEKNRIREALSPLKSWVDKECNLRLENALSAEEYPLEEFEKLLQFTKKIRAKIKRNLERQQKKSRGTGFDFAMAIGYQERFLEEKKRLDHIDASIAALEEKITDLTGDL